MELEERRQDGRRDRRGGEKEKPLHPASSQGSDLLVLASHKGEGSRRHWPVAKENAEPWIRAVGVGVGGRWESESVGDGGTLWGAGNLLNFAQLNLKLLLSQTSFGAIIHT